MDRRTFVIGATASAAAPATGPSFAQGVAALDKAAGSAEFKTVVNKLGQE